LIIAASSVASVSLDSVLGAAAVVAGEHAANPVAATVASNPRRVSRIVVSLILCGQGT
jgi:hypothetical protein